jgi:acetaldehyde dehydrogenase
VLNPAEPPVVMRDTVLALVEEPALDEAAVAASVEEMVAQVQAYVPGYRLKQRVQFDPVDLPFVPALDRPLRGTQVSVFLEVTGAGHYLPDYAGNLDIMTSAALRAAEAIAQRRQASTPTGAR